MAASVNPIIQAYLQSRQQALQAAESAAGQQKQQQQMQAEKEFRTESLKQAQERIDQEHEYQSKQLELAGKAHQLSADLAHMQMGEHLTNLIKSGVSPEAATSIAGGSYTPGTAHVPGVPDAISPSISLPGGTSSFDPSAIPGPAQEAERLKQQAQAQAEGQQAGRLPGEIQLSNLTAQHQQDLEKTRQQFENNKDIRDIASRENIAKLSRGTQMSIANMENATKLHLAGMGLDPDETDAVIKPLIMGLATGDIKPNVNSPLQRTAYSAMQQMGWRPLDPKVSGELQQLNVLSPLFDKLQKFTDYLPDENKPFSGIKAAIQGKITSSSPFPTDVQNQMAQISAQALNAGRAIEGFSGGRVLSKQLELELDSLTSPKITKQQAQSRLQNLKDMYINKERNVIMGGMPQSQQEVIKQKYGLQDPTDKNNDPLGIR